MLLLLPIASYRLDIRLGAQRASNCISTRALSGAPLEALVDVTAAALARKALPVERHCEIEAGAVVGTIEVADELPIGPLGE